MAKGGNGNGSVLDGNPASALASALRVNLRLGAYGAMAGQVLSEAKPAHRLVGVHLASTNPAASGLDVAFPAVFAALFAPLLTTRTTRMAAAAGAVATVITTPLLAPGLPILVAVAAALTAVALDRGFDSP